MKKLFDGAVDSVSNAVKGAASTMERASQEAKDSVRDKASLVAQAGKRAAFAVESSALEARDAVLDKTARVTGAMTKVCYGVIDTAGMLVEGGVIVAAVVAPVPTFIGVCLLWLLKWQLKGIAYVVDEKLRDDRAKRNIARVTSLLKRYGQIPETATLRTDSISMRINSRTGEVSGKVLAGEFKGTDLELLQSSDFSRLIAFAKDKDTRNILEAYQSLRNTRAEASAASAGESH